MSCQCPYFSSILLSSIGERRRWLAEPLSPTKSRETFPSHNDWVVCKEDLLCPEMFLQSTPNRSWSRTWSTLVGSPLPDSHWGKAQDLVPMVSPYLMKMGTTGAWRHTGIEQSSWRCHLPLTFSRCPGWQYGHRYKLKCWSFPKLFPGSGQCSSLASTSRATSCPPFPPGAWHLPSGAWFKWNFSSIPTIRECLVLDTKFCNK